MPISLHQKLRQMSYRPQAVRQVEIPKENGSMRQLGISCTEDKIVQELTRQILDAIYEPVFIETSYGFRSGRSCHDALRRLNTEVMNRPVNWLVDMDLAKFFDTMPHQDVLAVLSLRIKDRRFLQLLSRMMKAGLQTPSGIVARELGRPQGSIVLTHYWGLSRKGYVQMKRKTSKKRLRRALKSLNLWLKQMRNVLKLPTIWQTIGQKLRGHFNYYGISDNSRSLNCYEQKLHELLFKWLNRRSQKRSFTWESFSRYQAQHPLPRPGRLVSLYPSS